MPSMTETLNEALLPADKLDPANYAANTITTTGANMKYGQQYQFTLQIGVITGAATLDANLQSATNANFSDAVNITGTNLTQIANTAANTQVRICVRADQVVGLTAGDIYVRTRVVLGTNAAFLAGQGVVSPLYNKPAITNSGLNTAVQTQSVMCSL